MLFTLTMFIFIGKCYLFIFNEKICNDTLDLLILCSSDIRGEKSISVGLFQSFFLFELTKVFFIPALIAVLSLMWQLLFYYPVFLPLQFTGYPVTANIIIGI